VKLLELGNLKQYMVNFDTRRDSNHDKQTCFGLDIKARKEDSSI
jgi:hypothetical protein